MDDVERDHGSREELTRSERPSVPQLPAPRPDVTGPGERTQLPSPPSPPDVTGPSAVPTCPACQARNAPGATVCSSCGESIGPDPLLGTVIDERYEVVRRLGAGAMGAVYEVRHLRLSKRFAMKVIHRELSQVPEFVARFEREALSTSRLQHPNCILVTDFGHAQTGELYLVMEFLEGQSLSAMLDKPLPVGQALEVTRQILLGIEHAHQAGVIHRDLKPDNVVRVDKSDGSWEMKVVDFGIAKVPVGSSDSEPLTKAGVVFGTPQYMAPEQALGGDIGPHTDIYAVGAMLWRMITGRHVFEAEGNMELLTAKLSQPAPALDKIMPGVFSPSLQALLARCLERTPSQRLASAREMLEAIDRIRAERGGGLSTSTRQGTIGRGLATAARRLLTTAHGSVQSGGRTIVTVVSGWYRCEGQPGQPTWKVRARSLITTPKGAAVLGLAAAALALLVVFSVAMLGGDEGKARAVVQPSSELGTRPHGRPSAGAKKASRSSSAGKAHGTTPVPPPVPNQPGLERAQILLAHGACREAMVETQNAFVQNPSSARARYIYGAALYCQRMYREGLSAYAGAIALDANYRRAPQILDDVEKLLRFDKYRDLAFDFLEQKLGDAALPVFIRLASAAPKLAVRHRAVDVVARLGATGKVDWVSSLALDLKQLRSCNERGDVVEHLRQLKDVRAIPVLRAARDERAGFFGMRQKNYCIRKQIAAALKDLSALPGAAAYQ